MAFFEAFQNSSKSHNGDYANGNIILIKDGFCWPALFFTPFWLMLNGMWLIFALYIGLSLIFTSLGQFDIVPSNVAFWLNITISVIFAYEANFLRKWTLQRGNYRQIGVSYGGNIREAEVSFFSQFIHNDAESMLVQAEQAPTEVMSETEMVINPISHEAKTMHQKSHWKIGGKRKADSVVGMFSDD